MLQTILIILLIVWLIGGLPPIELHQYAGGPYPYSGIGLVIVILLVLILLGRL